jgi:hypothetical protein
MKTCPHRESGYPVTLSRWRLRVRTSLRTPRPHRLSVKIRDFQSLERGFNSPWGHMSHNHFTRDVKPPGECPSCDLNRGNLPVPNPCWCCGQECMFCVPGNLCDPEDPHWCAECKYAGCRMCCGCDECRRLRRAGWSSSGTPDDQRLPHLTPGEGIDF